VHAHKSLVLLLEETRTETNLDTLNMTPSFEAKTSAREVCRGWLSIGDFSDGGAGIQALVSRLHVEIVDVFLTFPRLLTLDVCCCVLKTSCLRVSLTALLSIARLCHEIPAESRPQKSSRVQWHECHCLFICPRIYILSPCITALF